MQLCTDFHIFHLVSQFQKRVQTFHRRNKEDNLSTNWPQWRWNFCNDLLEWFTISECRIFPFEFWIGLGWRHFMIGWCEEPYPGTESPQLRYLLLRIVLLGWEYFLIIIYFGKISVFEPSCDFIVASRCRQAKSLTSGVQLRHCTTNNQVLRLVTSLSSQLSIT